MTEMAVYQILFKPEGLAYVGSTTDLKRRWRRHRNDLARGTHHSRYLQRLWNKYGADAFEWSVLEAVLSESQLLATELVWVKQLNPALNTITPDVKDRLRFSDASRQRMSENRKGKTVYAWNKGDRLHPELCTVSGCARQAKANRGLCYKHYRLFRLYEPVQTVGQLTV
jgi:group I intron endonuclease